MNGKLLLLGVFVAIAAGCFTAQGGMQEDSAEAVPFSGTVVFNDFEGGFYGVITEEGTKLNGTLPPELQKNGLRVGGAYRRLPDRVSFRMWGTPVEFVDIHSLQEENF